MSPLWISWCLLAAPPQTWSAKEQPNAVLVLQAARRAEGLPSIALWLDGAAQGLTPATGLRVDSPERLGLANPGPCPPELLLGCVASGLEGPASPSFGVIVSVLPLEAGRLRVVPTLLDLRAERGRSDRGDPTAREDRLSKEAWSDRPSEIDGELPSDFQRLFQGLAQRSAPWLASRGLTRSGQILIHGDRPGAQLSLDGVGLGGVPEGSLLLVDVRPGRRTIALEPGGAQVLEVAPGHTATVSFTLAERPEPNTLRQGLRYGGPALVAVGAAVVALGILQRQSVIRACVGRPEGGADCADLGNPTLGLDAQAGPSTDPSIVNPGGLDLYGLGLGLSAAGLTAGALAWWGDEAQDPPWWLWVASAVALFGVYGVVHVGGRP
ncbi:MAG: hypothetical protein IPG45_14160 [Deltaproteobacteria bacterium]|nr:hypothetical protein [Deltaproteobacteria bacterium]